MSLEDQGRIKAVVEELGRDDMIVVLGTPDASAAEMYAETVTTGDPTYAGPLAWTQLRLPVFFITEPIIKRQIPEQVYGEQVGMLEMVLPTDEISERVKAVRGRAGIEQ